MVHLQEILNMLEYSTPYLYIGYLTYTDDYMKFIDNTVICIFQAHRYGERSVWIDGDVLLNGY